MSPRPPLAAHTPNCNGDWHELVTHLRAVAELAARFGAKFGAADAAHLLGLTHDLAKANPAFQERLDRLYQKLAAASVPHAYEGAAAMAGILDILAVCVQGHHSRMRDALESEARLDSGNEAAERAAMELAAVMDIQPIELPDWALASGRTGEMFVRMCFSCLIDADRLDSEAFGEPNAPRGGYPKIASYADFLRAHVGRFSRDDRPVTKVRRNVQRWCQRSAACPPGFFRLTVPTGGGKTLASLRFALEHAERFGLERVVVAIPFTSIIEQTAEIYASIFGEANVLAHHSAEPVVKDEEEEEYDERRKNASENWDIPLVVTTNVRLFDSLFGNTPGQCRRLHNLARAVIVLDEPQSLPADLLEPCLDALAWLVQHAGSTVVFCTATQPAYETLENLPAVLRGAREIVPRPERHFRGLGRVSYEYVGTLTHDEVAERLRREPQGLCVLNSRKDSLAVFRALNDDKALYLSTLLCADHRREVIAEIKRRLSQGENIRVVSTQVIESGVDVDFPFGMRAMGPMEALVQTAGRVNREGKIESKGRVEIFDLEGGKMPKGAYATAFSTAKGFVPTRLAEMDTPGLHRDYYADLFRGTVTDRRIAGPDGRKTETVQSARARRDFQTVSAEARLIEEDTVSVVARDRDPETVDRLLNGWMPARRRFRELGRFCVSLRRREANDHRRHGRIVEHSCGALVWRESYDDKVGLGDEVEFDPADLTRFG